MNADEFFRLHGDKKSIDLVRGVVIEYPLSGFKRGMVGANVAYFHQKYIDESDWGWGFINDTFIQTEWNPDTIRGMDIGFISHRRFPKDKLLTNDPLDVAPEIVFELLRPGVGIDVALQLVSEFLSIGVIVVGLVDTVEDTISVYRTDELPQRFHNGDTFELPDVLPGFSVPLKSFFT